MSHYNSNLRAFNRGQQAFDDRQPPDFYADDEEESHFCCGMYQHTPSCSTCGKNFLSEETE